MSEQHGVSNLLDMGRFNSPESRAKRKQQLEQARRVSVRIGVIAGSAVALGAAAYGGSLIDDWLEERAINTQVETFTHTEDAVERFMSGQASAAILDRLVLVGPINPEDHPSGIENYEFAGAISVTDSRDNVSSAIEVQAGLDDQPGAQEGRDWYVLDVKTLDMQAFENTTPAGVTYRYSEGELRLALPQAG